MNKILLVLSAIISLCLAEAPVSGPYKPAGWKPQGARLTLPTEYGPPKAQPTFEVEITKEQVEEIPETTTQLDVSNEYLPPTTEAPAQDDFLKVQGLPRSAAGPTFRQFKLARLQAPVQPLPFLLTGEFAPSFPITNNRQKFGRLEEPAQTYGPPATNYGVPEVEQPTTTEIPEEPEATEEPEDIPNEAEDEEEQEEETEEDDEPVVAISNAGTNSGQYYILSRDNTLQRVMFVTTQSEEDRQNNGFSAKLRYSPVPPITDPVYGFNDQGQLIRFYK